MRISDDRTSEHRKSHSCGPLDTICLRHPVSSFRWTFSCLASSRPSGAAPRCGKTPNIPSSNSVADAEDQSFGRKVFDESRAPLNALVHRPGQAIVYNYDFGDGREHEIPLEAYFSPSLAPSTRSVLPANLGWPVRSGRLRSDGRQR
ncbi:MAG: hypothetical protein JNK87_08410 [Bryobacterales bacterium]|nr:hypothetical protein [Bryobacterales bacterium]